MVHRLSSVLAFGVAVAGCAGPLAEGPRASVPAGQVPAPHQSGKLPVNGIRVYYEIHGDAEGPPLVLLHGGGSTIDVTWRRILPVFARLRTVIAFEEQAHGRTTDREGPVRFDSSADDVAAMLGALRVQQADVMGFSNGAIVALRLAIRHPARVRKLVFASSFTKRSGAAPGFFDFIANANFASMPQPLKDAFLQVNPDPAKLRTMHDKDVERMQHFIETTDDEVRSVSAPTLVITGDRDVTTPEHAVELSHLFPHARLLIMPGGHGDYLGELLTSTPASPDPALVAGLIEHFLGE